MGLTGASGALSAKVLLTRSTWPVTLIATPWGESVFRHECGDFKRFSSKAAKRYNSDNLWAPPASGSVPTVGMVIAPCSANTLAKIAVGIGDNLVLRAAHCHLKERRPLILVLRESPLTSIDLENASRVAAAGGIIMPLTPPFFMFGKQSPEEISLLGLLNTFADRVLSLLGQPARANWETISPEQTEPRPGKK